MTDWIGSRLAAWVRLVLRFRRLTLLIALVGGGFCLHYAVQNLGINTDTADMISPKLPWRQDFIEYQKSFPARTRNLIIVVDAAIPERADAVAAGLAAGLRGQPELYQAVFAEGEGDFFERNGLLYLSVAELEALAERLAEAQPLLGRMKQRFGGVRLIEVVEESVRHGQAGGEGLALQPVLHELSNALDAASHGQRYTISWQRLIRPENGQARRYVLLQPILDFEQMEPAKAVMDGVRQLIANLPAAQSPDVRVRVTGEVAMEHEELTSLSRGAGWSSVAALVMVTVVLYIALRSIVLLLISVGTLIIGLAGTAAFAAATVGHLNLVSVAFAVLYIGLGVDFIIHILMRVKELLRQGFSLERAIIDSVRGVGSSLVICAMTTAAAFYAFIPTSFQGVAELGLISGTGMFISLLVSLTVLPALTAQYFQEAQGDMRPRWLGARVLDPILARPRSVVVVAGIVAIGAALSLPRASFDRNPINLRDPASESVATLNELAAAGEALPLQMVAIAPDSGIASEWAQAVSDLPTVNRASSLDSFVPDDQLEKQLILQDIDLLMGPGFAELTHETPNPEKLRSALQNLREALTMLAEEQDEASAALSRNIQRFFGSLDAADKEMTQSKLNQLEQDLIGTLPDQLARLARGLMAQQFSRDALPEMLRIRWLSPEGRELVEFTAAEDISGNAATERFVESVRGVVVTATGLPVVYQEAGRTVVQAFQRGFLYAALLVGAILFVFLRAVRDSILVIIPIGLAAVLTTALTVVLGLEFNFANIIAMPLLLGVGVDSGIHMVHRMRSEPPAEGGIIETSTSKAVFASGLTTVASFGNLAFSSHPGMASMGQLLTLGMIVMIVATLILLPALLKLWGDP